MTLPVSVSRLRLVYTSVALGIYLLCNSIAEEIERSGMKFSSAIMSQSMW